VKCLFSILLDIQKILFQKTSFNNRLAFGTHAKSLSVKQFPQLHFQQNQAAMPIPKGWNANSRSAHPEGMECQ